MQHIAPQPLIIQQDIGNPPDKAGRGGQFGRQGCFFPRFLHQGFGRRQPRRNAARDQIIKLPRRHRLVARPDANPDMQPIRAAHQAIHMHALGHDAKSRQRAAVQRGQHRPIAGLAHVKGFAPDAQKPTLSQAGQGGGERIAPRPAGLQAAGDGHTMLVKMKIARAKGQRAGQIRRDEAHLRTAHVKGEETGGGGDVVAGSDMPGEAVHRPI